MGIRDLATFVKTLPSDDGQVWESFDLRDTNLVIDGCRLYFHIYGRNGLDCKFGGQYDELQKKVKDVFSKLRQNNVVPYVVFDGIGERNEKKSATYIRRNKEKIEGIKKLWTLTEPGCELVLPRLTKLAIVQVLQEMEVPYAVADFEADCEIASLANKLDAPVLSNDSDFYIFNIQHGYIPFKEYDFSGPNITVRKFSFDAFAKHLGLNPSMLPLLASLAGNDYISDEMLKPFHDNIVKSDKFQNISQFLSKYNYSDSKAAIDAVINLFPNNHKASFRKALDLSIQEYQMKQSNLIDHFDSAFSDDLTCNMLTYNGHPLPQWVVKLYRQGLIASEGLDCLCKRKIFLRTQCEDFTLPSTQICARSLRWHYFIILALNCEGASNTDSTSQATTEDIVVTEIDREKSERVEKKVNLTRVLKINVQTHDIPRMSKEAKNSHILSLLDSDLPSIHGLPLKHQLVVAAMGYWFTDRQIKPAHLAALLVYYVGENKSLTTEESPKISLKEFHDFPQWQNVLYWAERLNMLFSSTFPQLRVARLYDGVRVCKVYEKVRVSGLEFAESIVTNKKVYRRLYDVITKKLPRDRLLRQIPSTLKDNRFAVLSVLKLDED